MNTTETIAVVRDVALIIFCLVSTVTGFALSLVAWKFYRRTMPVIGAMQRIADNGAMATEVLKEQILMPMAKGVSLVALVGKAFDGLEGIIKGRRTERDGTEHDPATR